MKLLRFDSKIIRTIFERMGRFRPKHRIFMSWKKPVLIILPFLFLTIFFLNLFFPKSAFLKTKEDVVFTNGSPAHYSLAQQLFATNNIDLAKKEFLIADKGTPPDLNQPENIKQEIIYWQNLTIEVPNYRDAYLKLFSLSQKIYRDFDASKFLKSARETDPNNEIIKKLSLP